ncbi:TIGR04325 family methyltransferase [Lysobacter sp. TAF61]|uniref:TIGR04325 family methyltransferase n=1 Tax=Lysobacter sp. TAF61 TaxID=3233072 RepID=UPI003F9D4A3F
MNWVTRKLRRIAVESAELPVLRLIGKPLYWRTFSKPCIEGNSYFGAFQTREQALAAAPSLPTSYDQPATGNLYLDRHERIRVSDYPVVHWLTRLLAQGRHRIFDLGGHIGVSYYGFRRFLTYPQSMEWRVHDVPAVVDAGRAWAQENDPDRMLDFADTPDAASGHDVLISSGALQYLEYTLPELLARLDEPPPHVLVNMTPMHPQRGFITLQNIGEAVLPYRVEAKPEFIASMEQLGYQLEDQWSSWERNLTVPFEPGCTLNYYSGFYFRRA